MTCSSWGRVGFDPVQLGRQTNLNSDVFADEASQHRLNVRQDGVEVNRLNLEQLPAAKREQLLGERAGTQRGVANLLQIRPERLILAQLAEHRFGVAIDRRQLVVEIMGDPTGEQADGFHLLRLPKLGFQTVPLGHVFHKDLDCVFAALLVQDQASG